MKQRIKHNVIHRHRYVNVLLLVATIAAAMTIFFIKSSSTDATSPNKAGAASQFSFLGSTGWYQGPTRKTDMAIFSDAKNCFVSVQHITGSIADKQAQNHKSDEFLAQTNHTIEPISTQTMVVQTDNGPVQYQLLQSKVINPPGASRVDGSLVEGGQEYGYLPISNNDFLYIEGYCDTSDQLSTTIPVLKAIKFDVKQ